MRPFAHILKVSVALGSWVVLLLIFCGSARAAEGDSPALWTAERALPGFFRVGLARSQAPEVALRAGVSYGFIDAFTGLYGPGHRLGGEAAVAYAPVKWGMMALDFSGRLDLFSWRGEGENGTGEPRLTLRGLLWEQERIGLGLQVDARFIGSAAPSIDFEATSPAIVGLLRVTPTDKSELGVELGVHIDRSGYAIDVPERLSAADRVTLSASAGAQLRFGLAYSQRLPPEKALWLAEFRTDLLLDQGAAYLGQSPMTLSIGARHPLRGGLGLEGRLELGFSARPSEFTSGELIPIAPRAGLSVALLWAPEKKQPPAPKVPQPEEEPPPPPPPAQKEEPKPVLVEITGRVIDESGAGIPDAEIRIALGEEQLPSVWTNEDGSFRIEGIEENKTVSLEVHSTGFDIAKRTHEAKGEAPLEILLYEALPRGLVRGSVRDVLGGPLPATIQIEPDGPTIEAEPDGSFQVELAPGTYRIIFDHPGFGREMRSVTVIEHGVVILNIGLAR